MAKYPYYPYYVYDFDDDPNVLAMDLAEVGLYQLALNEAWKRGSIPDDPKHLALLIRRPVAAVKKSWAKVRICWIENGVPGRLVNPRMEREREAAFRRNQRASKGSDALHGDVLPEEKRGSQAAASAFECDSESDSRCSTPSVENPSTRTREEISGEDFLRRWANHRKLRKPPKPSRPDAARKWEETNDGMTEDELSAALDGFVSSEWAQRNNFPIFGFLKDPRSWMTTQPDSHTQEPESAAPSLQSLPDSRSAVVLSWRSDAGYTEYLHVGLKHRGRISDEEASDGYTIWQGLSEEQRRLSIEDYRTVGENAGAPRYVPSPKAHLRKNPWLNLLGKVQPKDEKLDKQKAYMERQLAVMKMLPPVLPGGRSN